MLQAHEVLAAYSPSVNAGRRQDGCAALLSGNDGRAVPEQTGAYSDQPTGTAEAIVGELINQYFRCSTSMSGVFLCW